MLRKLLAVTGVAALTALVPVAAHAAPGDNGLVVVFSGDAQVGGSAWTTAPGQGICFPGLDPATGCGINPNATVPTNGWNFDVPATTGPVVGCFAYGNVGGNQVTADPLSDPEGNCTIASDGDVGVNLAGVGPSCGVSGGVSTSAQDSNNNGVPDDEDTALGNGADTFSINDGPSGAIDTQWLSSAGGTLPIIGSITIDGVTTDYAGVVQARPIPSSDGQVPCLTEPADTFFVIGVTAGAATA